MAIAVVGTLGTGLSNNATATTSLTLTTATNTLSAGQIGVLSICSRNTTTTTGATNNHNLPTGGTGYWWKLSEHTYSPGGVALDGLTISTWMFMATATLNTGTVITMTMTSVAEKSATFHKFTVGAGAVLFIYTGPQNNSLAAANNFGSVSFAGLPSTSRLYYRTLGKAAGVSVTNITPSTNFTAVTNSRSRNNAAGISVYGEFRINTSTGETSNPTLAVSAVAAGSFIVFEEITKVAASSFIDNFDDNILTGWTDGDEAGATLSETGQQLRLAPPAAGTTGASQAIAATRYDMTGDAFYVCLIQAGVAGNDLVISKFKLLSDNGEYNWPIVSDNGSTNIYGEKYINTVGTDPYGPVAYVATTHQWFRLRHDVATDTIVWETAPKGKNPPESGDWVTRYSEARVLNVQSVRPYLIGQNAEAVTGGGTTIFDGFNTGANTLGTEAAGAINDGNDTISSTVSQVTTADVAFTDASDLIAILPALDLKPMGFLGAPFFDTSSLTTTTLGYGLRGAPFVAQITPLYSAIVFTDATDTISADATVTDAVAGTVTADAVFTDATDTVSSDASISTNVAVSLTDDTDTVASTVSQVTTADSAFTDATDTISSTVSQVSTADSAFTDATDTVSADASITTNAAVSFTDDTDTVSSTVSQVTTADSAFTDATDTVSSTVSQSTTADFTFTDADDTISAAATVTTNVAVSLTDDTDTISSTVSQVTNVAVSFTDDTDTISASASDSVAAIADVSFTDATDTISADATVSGGAQPEEETSTHFSGGSGKLLKAPRRPKPFTYTYQTVGDMPIVTQARLRYTLEDVTLDARAEVGVKEIARGRRLAGIAALVA